MIFQEASQPPTASPPPFAAAVPLTSIPWYRKRRRKQACGAAAGLQTLHAAASSEYNVPKILLKEQHIPRPTEACPQTTR